MSQLLGSLASSPFKPHLNTNYAPTPSEAAQIRELLKQPQTTLNSLSLEIANAEAALALLRQKHNDLQSAVNAHQALLTPIRRLPHEVLQEIFLHSLPTTHYPILSLPTPPLLLTLICKSWRALALNTPRLWSSLHLPIPYTRSSEDAHLIVTQRRLTALSWWINHAGSTGLSISLYWSPSMRTTWGTDRVFPNTVLTYAHRLVELELDLPNTLLDAVVRHPGSGLPCLRRIALYLKVAPGKEPRGAGVGAGAIWTAEQLERVVWHHVEDDILHAPLRWESLKELELVGTGMTPLSYLSVEDAKAVLRVARSLEKLTVQLMYYEEGRNPERFPHPAVSSHRERLDEEEEDGDPRQDEIEVEGREGEDETSKTLILDKLTHLDIFDTKYDYDQPQFFSPYLQLPALTSLTYRTHYSTYSELQSIAALFEPSSVSESSSYSYSPFHLHPTLQTEYAPDPACPLLTFLSSQLSFSSSPSPSLAPTPIPLQTLTIHAESMTQPLLLSCLSYTPLLTRLVVYDSVELAARDAFEFNESVEVAPRDSFLWGLNGGYAYAYATGGVSGKAKAGEGEGEKKDVLCPNLESLTVSRSTFSEGALAQFVKLRTDKHGNRVGLDERKRLVNLDVGLARYRPLEWVLDLDSTLDSDGDFGVEFEFDSGDGHDFDLGLHEKDGDVEMKMSDETSSGTEYEDTIEDLDSPVLPHHEHEHEHSPHWRPDSSSDSQQRQHLDSRNQLEPDHKVEPKSTSKPKSTLISIPLEVYLATHFGINATIRYASLRPPSAPLVSSVGPGEGLGGRSGGAGGVSWEF